MSTILILFSLTFKYTHAQTLEGTTGLLFIPTAEMQNDKTVMAGINYVSRELVSFGGFNEDAVTPFITLSYLPFVELNIKITRLIDSKVKTQGIGDRTFSARILFLNESYYTPAIVIGLHDLMTVFGGSNAIHNNALYIVCSKKFLLNADPINSFSLHLGYGTDKLKAGNHNFVGIFGGVSFNLFKRIELMTEYDGKRASSGLRIKLLNNHISLLGGFISNKYFSGGLSFSI